MRPFSGPCSLPQYLEPNLSRVLVYWEGLKHGEANMPFWDDMNISALPDLLDRLMLIDVFNKPIRFRLAIFGNQIKAQHGSELVGKFLDELEVRDPLSYLNSQSSATVESRAPTYYRSPEAGRAGTLGCFFQCGEMGISGCCWEPSAIGGRVADQQRLRCCHLRGDFPMREAPY